MRSQIFLLSTQLKNHLTCLCYTVKVGIELLLLGSNEPKNVNFEGTGKDQNAKNWRNVYMAQLSSLLKI